MPDRLGTSPTGDMQGCTFIGRVLLAALVVLADVSNGKHPGNGSCANDDDQALLQARVKNVNITIGTVTGCDPDDTPPVLSVPSDIRFATDLDKCKAEVPYPYPSAEDDCDPDPVVEQTEGLGSLGNFPVGITTESFNATDYSGNTASGSFTVTVYDSQDPQVSSVPADITVNTRSGQCVALVTFAAPTASDNCPGVEIAQTSGYGSGAAFPLGSTTVSFTATDASGNTDDESFTVTVNDNEDPVPVLPADIVVSSDPGMCGASVTYLVDATDNCGATIALTIGLGSGAIFPVGPATTETYTATDAAGNTASGSFNVTVNDNEDPKVSPVPADITADTAPGQCAAFVTFAAPTASDNCPGVEIAQTSGYGSGAAFPLGSTTVSFTATDASGNTDDESFTVTVNDKEDPEFYFLSDIVVSSDPGVCAAEVTYPVDATDNCGGARTALTSGLGSGAIFPVGPATTETYTATDAAGNTASGSFTVTVNDNEDPKVSSVPADITVNTRSGECFAFVTFAAPTASDNCPGVEIAQTSGPLSGRAFPVGSTTVRFTATDASGNTDDESFTVTVNDNKAPRLLLPFDIVESSDRGVCGAEVFYPVDALDNCEVTTIAQTSGLGSRAFFPVGPATTESYTATDAAGNTVSGSFTVRVYDTEFPKVSPVPADIAVDNDPGQCVALVTFAAPTASDNCPGVELAQTSGPLSGAAFPVGSTTVSFTATDATGRTDQESFTVTVNDNEDPVPVLPADIVVSSDPGVCGANVTYLVDAADNCGATIALTSGLGSGAIFPVGPATTESYTATDAAGNTASGSFTVTVNDNDPPALEVEDISVDSCSPTVVSFSPTAADNCPGVTAACSPSSGSEFPVGETEVTCTAVDAAGSTTQESFVVLVECAGHGYHKKSHSNNIRSRRSRRLKKWLYRNRRLKKWWHRKLHLKKWSHFRRYWHH